MTPIWILERAPPGPCRPRNVVLIVSSYPIFNSQPPRGRDKQRVGQLFHQKKRTKTTMAAPSLISSIFGDAPAAVVPDLFDSKFSVPPVLHKFATAHKGKKEEESDLAVAVGPSNSNSSSEGIPIIISNDAPSSSSTSLDPLSPEEDAKIDKSKGKLKEEEDRTIFVGNLPPDITRRSLAGIFKPCGTVTSTRLRSMAVAGVKLPPDQAGNQVSVFQAEQ